MMFAVGDRVKVTNYKSNFGGKQGVVTKTEGEWLPYFVLLDSDSDGKPIPFGTRELTKIEEETE